MRISAWILTALLFLGAAAGPACSVSHCDTDWGYGRTDGPRKWCTIDDGKYKSCCAPDQSPIDIRKSTPDAHAAPVFDYKPFHPVVTNNGHTIQVSAPAG